MPWKKVGVVGGGTMGQGIAEMLASKGLDVMLAEKNQKRLNQAIEAIEISLDKQLEKWAITQAEKKLILSKIHRADSLDQMKHCGLVIETITEDLDEKKKLFRQMD